MAVNLQSTQDANKYKKDLNGCKENDLLKMASFVTESLGLRMTLMPSLEAHDPATGRVIRTPGSGFNIQFKAGEYHTWSSKQVELIMTSAYFQSGKININPEDPDGFWNEQGLLTVETVKVVSKSGQSAVSFAQIDFEKVTAPKEGEKKESHMIVN